MVRVVVIGAGIMGVCSAYQIQEEYPNFDITIVADKFSPDNTSDGAAGIWRAANVGNTPRSLIKKWSEGTRNFVLNMLKLEDAHKMGLSLVNGYLVSSRVVPTLEWEEMAPACHILTKLELQRFPKRIKSGCSYSSVMIEASMFIPYLSNKFMKKGGKIIRRKIDNVKQLHRSYDLIINCCGLGAKDLLNDNQIHPVRGQTLIVKAPWIKEFVFNVDVDENGRTCYIFPNQNHVVLGGTRQENNDSLEAQLYEREVILNSTNELVPSLKDAQIICDWVGLRPGRSAIRLEKEIQNVALDDGCYKKGVIIHNYGHGGNGITLSWGCCQNVVELIKETLAEGTLKVHCNL